MRFDNLALTGWSYEKGDKEISVDSLGLPKNVLSRNPVSSTFIYSDESSWSNRLLSHVTKVMELTSVGPDNIQAVFGVHNGYKRHPEGAAQVAMDLISKEHDPFMAEMTNGCMSVILAAQMAGLHLSAEEIQNILVASVQLTTQYTNSCTDGNCLFADSIGALMFSRAKKGNMVRYTNLSSNSDFRDMFNISDEGIYSMANLHKGRDLSEYMVKTFNKHLMQACRSMKTFPKDLDFIALSCSTYAATKMVLEKINFPVDRTGLECLTKVPHMGTNDLMYQLNYGIEQGLISKGSKILVAGTSLGFSMGTMGIEWGV